MNLSKRKAFEKQDEAEGLLDALEYKPEEALQPEVEIITANPQLQEILGYARKAARTDMPVLIVGETGTGKELVARMIHQHSNRRDKKFIFISCASLPDFMLEDEIFGHDPQAFTRGDYKEPVSKWATIPHIELRLSPIY